LPDGLKRAAIRPESTGLGGSNPVRSTSQAVLAQPSRDPPEIPAVAGRGNFVDR
jgi:hypothetical protein